MEEISSEAVREVPPSAGSTYLVQLRSVVPLFVKTYGESSLMQRYSGGDLKNMLVLTGGGHSDESVFSLALPLRSR